MKKTVVFALLMMVSIGVFANQRTDFNSKDAVTEQLKNTEYQTITSNIDSIHADDYQKTVSTHDLIKLDYRGAATGKMFCGQSGLIFTGSDEDGWELVGEWYTTCAEPGPPYPIHTHMY